MRETTFSPELAFACLFKVFAHLSLYLVGNWPFCLLFNLVRRRMEVLAVGFLTSSLPQFWAKHFLCKMCISTFGPERTLACLHEVFAHLSLVLFQLVRFRLLWLVRFRFLLFVCFLFEPLHDFLVQVFAIHLSDILVNPCTFANLVDLELNQILKNFFAERWTHQLLLQLKVVLLPMSCLLNFDQTIDTSSGE